MYFLEISGHMGKIVATLGLLLVFKLVSTSLMKNTILELLEVLDNMLTSLSTCGLCSHLEVNLVVH
mgnify:FL=1